MAWVKHVNSVATLLLAWQPDYTGASTMWAPNRVHNVGPESILVAFINLTRRRYLI